MKAPFPWFGGKRRVADKVWPALGDVDNYVEPFAGSLAVLLERPGSHVARAETVNDADGFVANVWRAIAAAPDEVARWCDWPVNEADLMARHLWLVNEGRDLLGRLEGDPEWFDAKVAGWWLWGVNAWIGSGWCSGRGPWRIDPASKRPHLGDAGRGVNRQRPHLGTAGQGVNRKLPHLGDAGQGVNRQLPHLGNAGRGVNRQLPHLGDAGRGVNRQLPHLGTAGQGVNRQLPHLGDAGRGVNQPDGDDAFTHGGSGAPRSTWTNDSPDLPAVYGYMQALARRLRRVRVCCGDWSRVVTTGALNYGATKGIFLDPPYLGDVRTNDLYAVDDHTIAHEVREWCIANGDDPSYRIVLAGYAPEHEAHMPASWRMERYSASKAYGSSSGGGQNAANRHLEALWFSPHCLSPAQGSLFDEVEA